MTKPKKQRRAKAQKRPSRPKTPSSALVPVAPGRELLRKDTPLDAVPVVSAEAVVGSVLGRAQRLETIEAAYAAWAELQDEYTQRRADLAAEFRLLDEHAVLLLGAVRTAHGAAAPSGPEAPDALTHGNQLDAFLAGAREKLAEARSQVEARQAAEARAFSGAFTTLAEEIRQRLIRRSLHVKPTLRVMVRLLPAGQRILHAQRLDPDDAVAFLFAVTNRIPSRYGYLFDDSTDDVTAPPPWLYPDDGLLAEQTRATPSELRAALDARATVWPVKGMVPLRLPSDQRLARWLQRGPVMEAEVEEGGHFRNVLSHDEAERFLGLMLSLKLEAKIDFELVNG